MSSLIPWREHDRELILNRARRRLVESRTLGAIYWWQQERKAPRRARLAKKALSKRYVRESFWRYQDVRVNPRSKPPRS